MEGPRSDETAAGSGGSAVRAHRRLPFPVLCARLWDRRRDPLSASTLALVLALLALTLADGMLTLVLLEDRFEEANPVMRVLLGHGPTAFVVGKYILTAFGIPFLLLYGRRSVFRPWLRVEHVLPTLVAFFVVLLIYQIGLLIRI